MVRELAQNRQVLGRLGSQFGAGTRTEPALKRAHKIAFGLTRPSSGLGVVLQKNKDALVRIFSSSNSGGTFPARTASLSLGAQVTRSRYACRNRAATMRERIWKDADTDVPEFVDVHKRLSIASQHFSN